VVSGSGCPRTIWRIRLAQITEQAALGSAPRQAEPPRRAAGERRYIDGRQAVIRAAINEDTSRARSILDRWADETAAAVDVTRARA
jgi:hypothetical protein